MPGTFFLITFFSRALGKLTTVFLPEENAHELPELTRLLKLGDGDYAITLGDRCHRLPDVDPLNPPHERKDETMSTPYTCPACGHHITRGNPANIHLHQIVSHSGKTPIVAQDTPAPAQ